MERKRYEGSSRARVLAATIKNKAVCSRVANQWDPQGLFDTQWANTIAGWCVKHIRKYGEPPNSKIRSIFETWARDTPSVSHGELSKIELFMSQLVELSYEEESDEYLLDLAGDYFNAVRLEREVAAAQLEIESGKHNDAHERLRNLKRVEMGSGEFVEPAASFSLWEEAFHPHRTRSLVKYTGAVGEFFKGAFAEGEFYAFLASEKSGKTSYLIDFTYRALRARNRVAYFECGDGDRDEVLTRIGCRITMRPEFGGQFHIPVKWEEDGTLRRSERRIEATTDVDAFQMLRRYTRSEESFKLHCVPNSTLNVQGIEDQLALYEEFGFRPHVVVIDYADILASPKYVKDKIEAIDTTWRQLRRISQSRHCLIVTATQANSAAYKLKGLLGREHFSGSKTKNAHVNGIIGINVSEDERVEHRGRLNWVARRKNKGGCHWRCVHVAGCFHLDCPIILSRR